MSFPGKRESIVYHANNGPPLSRGVTGHVVFIGGVENPWPLGMTGVFPITAFSMLGCYDDWK
jgi:hypothetical protein